MIKIFLILFLFVGVSTFGQQTQDANSAKPVKAKFVTSKMDVASFQKTNLKSNAIENNAKATPAKLKMQITTSKGNASAGYVTLGKPELKKFSVTQINSDAIPEKEKEKRSNKNDHK